MFTGLVEEMGAIASLEKSGDGVRVTIEASVVLGDISHGDSINVGGTCLSAIDSLPPLLRRRS
jgi:riboflavin synthase